MSPPIHRCTGLWSPVPVKPSSRLRKPLELWSQGAKSYVARSGSPSGADCVLKAAPTSRALGSVGEPLRNVRRKPLFVWRRLTPGGASSLTRKPFGSPGLKANGPSVTGSPVPPMKFLERKTSRAIGTMTLALSFGVPGFGCTSSTANRWVAPAEVSSLVRVAAGRTLPKAAAGTYRTVADR
ncbi:hypothetical protein GCM10010270_75150 [Streptomyces violaceus]|nr:hypothetical protein GCM10010270_75150 [Streptomyces janthinus]